MLAFKVRDTVQGVVGASRHLLWYLEFQMGGAAPRSSPARAGQALRRAA